MGEKIKGTNVAAAIVPFTTDDSYATHDAKYGKGGYRTVETEEELNSIPEARKAEGMLVFVVENKRLYQLKKDLNEELVWEALVEL